MLKLIPRFLVVIGFLATAQALPLCNTRADDGFAFKNRFVTVFYSLTNTGDKVLRIDNLPLLREILLNGGQREEASNYFFIQYNPATKEKRVSYIRENRGEGHDSSYGTMKDAAALMDHLFLPGIQFGSKTEKDTFDELRECLAKNEIENIQTQDKGKRCSKLGGKLVETRFHAIPADLGDIQFGDFRQTFPKLGIGEFTVCRSTKDNTVIDLRPKPAANYFPVPAPTAPRDPVADAKQYADNQIRKEPKNAWRYDLQTKPNGKRLAVWIDNGSSTGYFYDGQIEIVLKALIEVGAKTGKASD
jgi:hypothetical protein